MTRAPADPDKARRIDLADMANAIQPRALT